MMDGKGEAGAVVKRLDGDEARAMSVALNPPCPGEALIEAAPPSAELPDTLLLEPDDETCGHNWDTVCLNCRMPLDDWSGEVCAGPRDEIRGPSAGEIEDACRWADEQHDERPAMLAQRNRDEALRWLRAWCKVRDFKAPSPLHLLGDEQAFTPVPTHCNLWQCHRGGDPAPLAVNALGFMECTRCCSTWGRPSAEAGP